jgi:iron complex transport system substrate-binding protein
MAMPSGAAKIAMVMLAGAGPLATLFWNPFGGSGAAKLTAKAGQIQVWRSGGSRMIRHAAGLSQIPAKPQRICALAFIDELLLLGVQPAAAPSDWGGKVVDYLAPQLAGVRRVPQGYAGGLPSLEAIAAMQPDLILASPADQNEYRQLAAIAPTVVLRDAATANHENRDLGALKRRLRDLGAVLGREAEAESAIAAFDEHVQASRAAIGDRMRGKTIAFFRTRERDWRMYGGHGDNGAEAVYQALGLQAPKSISQVGMAALDAESLAGFDVDYLIVVGDETLGAHETLNRLRRNQLWQRVTAIRENHVLEINTYRHWIASGLLGKRRMIDEFVACVTGPEQRAGL